MMKWMCFCVLIISFACKKAENRTCFKFNGEEKIREVAVGEFSRLRLNSQLNYVLIQDSLNKLVIKGGENVIQLVEWKNSNGLLELTNNNRCKFLRDGKKVITVEIHCKTVSNIHYEGTESLTNEGVFNSDYFVLLIRDGAGPVNLNLKSIIINADVSHGWGDYTFSGTTQVASISCRSNGFCNTYGLTVTDSIYVSSDTSADMKINANGLNVYGFLKGNGSVFYKGTPLTMKINDVGNGSILKEN